MIATITESSPWPQSLFAITFTICATIAFIQLIKAIKES